MAGLLLQQPENRQLQHLRPLHLAVIVHVCTLRYIDSIYRGAVSHTNAGEATHLLPKISGAQSPGRDAAGRSGGLRCAESAFGARADFGARVGKDRPRPPVGRGPAVGRGRSLEEEVRIPTDEVWFQPVHFPACPGVPTTRSPDELCSGIYDAASAAATTSATRTPSSSGRRATSASRPGIKCPVCAEREVYYVSYVYGDGLRARERALPLVPRRAREAAGEARRVRPLRRRGLHRLPVEPPRRPRAPRPPPHRLIPKISGARSPDQDRLGALQRFVPTRVEAASSAARLDRRRSRLRRCLRRRGGTGCVHEMHQSSVSLTISALASGLSQRSGVT